MTFVGSSHPHVLQLDPIIAEKLTMFRPSFEEVGEEKTQQEAKDMATQVWRKLGMFDPWAIKDG